MIQSMQGIQGCPPQAPQLWPLEIPITQDDFTPLLLGKKDYSQQKIAISIVDSVTDTSPKATECTWGNLIRVFSKPKGRGELSLSDYLKAEKDVQTKQKNGKGLIGGEFLSPGTRKREALINRSVLILDLDDGHYAFNTLAELLQGLGLECFVHSSYSHSQEKGKFRIFVLLDKLVVQDIEGVISRMVDYFESVIGPHIDPKSRTVNQLFFTPSCPPDAVDLFRFQHIKGEPLKVSDFVKGKAVERKILPVGNTHNILHGVDEGGRTTALTKVAGSVIARGLSLVESTEFCLTWNQKNNPPLEDDEVEKTVGNIFAADQKKKELMTDAPSVFTDTRVARFFTLQANGLIKYWPDRGHFLVFDGTRFNATFPGGPFTFIKEMVAALTDQARLIPGETERIGKLKDLLKLESHQKQCAVLESAKNIPELIVTSAMLDSDPMLLNVLNGTIDLKKGRLLAHNPADLITRRIDMEYDPEATCPVFLAFLEKIMGGNARLISYLQRWLGYCLSGMTSEQVLLFLFGKGRNGKTTLVNIVRELLGEFATTADGGIILNGTGNDLNSLATLAGLRGTRLVTLNEINDGDRLNEAAVKNFTGQDEISCRFLHQGFFSYRPQFKLLLFGNYKPNIRGRDYGVWRRIHLLNFGVTITDAECDPHLDQKLRNELPGILTWAVKGCLAWQKMGLNPPCEVKAAVDEYKRAEDMLQSWIDEFCEIGPQFSERPQALLSSFINFSHWKSLNPNKFGRMLSDAGFEKSKSGGDRRWSGIRLNQQINGNF
ncbi:MAG: phage/plasmid primase, P4 family [Desulfocapsaceae bacterium]|nr:phage/plasmid primase, P4 family [Desulfocapsaceae bacterium]